MAPDSHRCYPVAKARGQQADQKIRPDAKREHENDSFDSKILVEMHLD